MTSKERSKIPWAIWLRIWGTILWIGSSERWESEWLRLNWQVTVIRWWELQIQHFLASLRTWERISLFIPSKSQWISFNLSATSFYFFLLQQPGVTAELYTNASLSIQRDMPELYARIRPEIRFAHEAFFIQDESEIRRSDARWLSLAFHGLQLQLWYS